MGAELVLKYALLLHIMISLATLALLFYRKAVRTFPAFAALLAVNVVNQSICAIALFYRVPLHIPHLVAYHLYYWEEWAADIFSLTLTILIIYAIFSEAMRPFPGIQRLGGIIFRWVGAASLLVALALATGPQVFSRSVSAFAVVQELISRLLQGVNVLILCLLIFVCFALRPLGLTFRSRVFGMTLGLALVSTVQLVQVAWTAISDVKSLYSPVFTFGAAGGCVALSVWFAYFAMPQPERRMILLPTTSPFFLWNRISEILGDAPGNVAVAGFTPDMLAPGEIQMLTAATAHEAARERELAEENWQEVTSPLPEFVTVPRALALSQ